MPLAGLYAGFQSLPPLPTSKLGPSGADSQVGGWVCACSRTLWVSPMNSPVRLGVSPTAATTPTDFYSQRFWGFISLCWNPGLRSLSRFPVFPPGSSACQCRTACSASHHFAASPLCPSCLSPPLLPVWVNVSSLTPRLLDFHTVRFSGSSGCFLFLNVLLSFFWLYEEAKYIYLCLQLGQKSILRNFIFVPYLRKIKFFKIKICYTSSFFLIEE